MTVTDSKIYICMYIHVYVCVQYIYGTVAVHTYDIREAPARAIAFNCLIRSAAPAVHDGWPVGSSWIRRHNWVMESFSEPHPATLSVVIVSSMMLPLRAAAAELLSWCSHQCITKCLGNSSQRLTVESGNCPLVPEISIRTCHWLSRCFHTRCALRYAALRTCER